MEFPSTHWSLLARATLHGESGPTAELEEFCGRYRSVVVAFVRLRGFDAAEAEDLAHDFLVHMMEKSTLRRADAARGRFRSFLLGALVRFLGDERDRRRAVKRGGGQAPLSLDHPEGGAGLASVPAPEAERFDQAWAQQILEFALRRIEDEYTGRGRAALFASLRAFLPGSGQPPAYETVAAEAGLSPSAVKTEVHRVRQRLRAAMREEIARTVSDPLEVDDEIAYLGRALRSEDH